MVGQPADLSHPPPPASSGGQHTQQRKQRRDKGQIRFTPRDLEVLRWIGEQYAVRLDTLQVLLGRQAQQTTLVENLITESSARRVLDRWKQEKLVASRKILAREPEWVWLTPHGLRHTDLPYKPKEPSASQLLHLNLVNQIRLRLEVKYEDFQFWSGERQLRYEHWNEKQFHVPDGEVVTTNNGVVGVEIERTQKSRQRVDTIVRQLLYQYEKVWYFVTPETRQLVETATAKYRETFSLLNLEDFVK